MLLMIETAVVLMFVTVFEDSELLRTLQYIVIGPEIPSSKLEKPEPK